MTEPLLINQHEAGSSLFIELAGSLDGHTASQLEHYFSGLLAEPGFSVAVIDLHQLTYVSSAGIGIFIGTQQQLRERGGDLLLVAPIPIVKEIFKILGLHALFTIHDNREDALTALRDRQP